MGLREVRRQYGREARRYDARWEGYLRGTLEPTLARLGEGPGPRLLDVACGTGILLDEVARRWPTVEAWGVDASPEMLRLARSRLPASAGLVLGDVHRLPFADAAFHTVTSTSALHHWPRPERALGEMARVTRPGGRLVLTDWCEDFLALRLLSRVLRRTDPSHHRAYRAAEASRLLEDAGFRVRSVRRFRAGWRWGMMTLTAERRGAG